MAYNGYLMKIGGVNMAPYIKPSTYEITPDQVQDLDSTRTTEGDLKRTALSHTCTKIEWQSPYNNNKYITDITGIFRDNYTVPKERRLNVNYYDMLTDSYKTGVFYVPDITFTVACLKNNDIIYEPVRFALIEY